MPQEFDYLLIDISNSFTKIVPSNAESLGDKIISIPTNEINERCLKDLSWNSDYSDFGVILSSVVPKLNDEVESVFGKERILEVSNSVHIGCEIDYPDPRSIGADRLANVAAAVSLYGEPAVIVDFGTAVTFDVISSEKSYIGGVIAPGLTSMTDYMFDHTALLPRIDLDEPSSIIGKSTEDAMLSGAVIGYRCLVKEIISSCSCPSLDAHLVVPLLFVYPLVSILLGFLSVIYFMRLSSTGCPRLDLKEAFAA
ncbi:MAG: type III pantothenate kinase [Verrucomicrobiales bacterium]|nr:type III pantothenate kinase [Verrucomicrobiales bacterium]